MRIFDFLAIIFFVVSFLLLDNTKISTTVAFFSSLAYTLPIVLVLRWPKRIRNSYQASKLLKRREHSAIGIFIEVYPFDTGKEKTVSVLDGYTQKAFSAQIYNHYHFEKQKVYDGYVGIFQKCDEKDGKFYYNNQVIKVRTLPSSAFKNDEELPPVNELYKIYYVTDPDGIHYFVDAEPIN